MRCAVLLAVCAWIVTAASEVTAQSYSVYPLDGQFHPFFVEEDINNALQVVRGHADPLIWDRSPQSRRLPVPAGWVTGLEINNAGVIAGARELGPGRSELFTIENGQYIPRSLPFAMPYVIELTDSGVMLVGDEATRTTWIVQGSHVQQLEEPAYDVNDSGVLVGPNYVRFPSGGRVVPWPEPMPVLDISANGHLAGGGCNSEGCTVLYARPDLATARFLFAGAQNLFSTDLNRAGELVVTVEQRSFFFRQVINFVYRDGPIIDLNEVLARQGWLVCDTRGITDQGAILATAVRMERLGNSCGPVVLYPDPPAAPQHVVAHVSGRLVGLNWTSGSDVRDHIIEVGSAPGASNLLRMSIGAQPSVAGLAPSGRYYVRIRAQNGAGIGAASAEVIVDVR